MNSAKVAIAISLAGLVIALLIDDGNPDYRLLLPFTLCAFASLMVLQALRAKAEYASAKNHGNPPRRIYDPVSGPQAKS